MYEKPSRYYGLETYEGTDHRGRTVPVVPVPEPPSQSELGVHLRTQGQRLDHLAHRYLKDPTAFWRICHLNGVMLPEALSEAREIKIPRVTKG